jgi:hypothetical protein
MSRKITVTQDQINNILDTAETQETIFWNKELLISYRIYNGFTITGRGACVDPNYFDIQLGRKYAREDAANQLWQLEGYLLQNKMHNEKASNCNNECKCSSKKEPRTREEWTALFSSYDFVDEQGHSLTMCTDFIDLVELAVR